MYSDITIINKETFVAAYVAGERYFTDIEFRGGDFADVNFAGCYLSKVKFSDITFGKENFRGARLAKVKFNRVTFDPEANFIEVKLDEKTLFELCLNGRQRDFRKADFSGNHFESRDTFFNCNFSGANFDDTSVK